MSVPISLAGLLDALSVQRAGLDLGTIGKATDLIDSAGFLSAQELAAWLNIGEHQAANIIELYLEGTPGAREAWRRREKAIDPDPIVRTRSVESV